MRYVGRHRGPRPLLLRRPVVGGVAAAALLAGPVLYVTGSFSGAVQSGTPTKQIADGTTSSPGESSLDAETDPESTVIPTDDATDSPTVTKGPTKAPATTGGGGYRAPLTRTTRPTTRPSTPRKTRTPSHTRTTTRTTTKSPTPTATKSPTPSPTTPPPVSPDPQDAG